MAFLNGRLLALGALLLAVQGCAEVTRPKPSRTEVEACQLAAIQRYPHQTWSLERVSRVYLRLLSTVPQVHGRTYPFLGFDWWVTAAGKVTIDNVWSPSPAHDAGLKQGDVILSVSNWPVHPWVADWDRYIKTVRDGTLIRAPGELLAGAMLDAKHLRLEARGQYLSGAVDLLIQRGDEKLRKTLYPQHLPAEYGILVDTKNLKINAYAAPGKIILTQRLVHFCRTDDELALVVGHELAHQVLGHQVRRAAHQELGQLVGEVVTAVTTFSLRNLLDWRSFPRSEADVRRVARDAVVSVFSKDNEREADVYGLWYAYQQGYDPDRALEVLERLGAVMHDPFERTYFLDQHPAPLERMARLKIAAQYFKSGRAAQIFVH